MSSSILITSPHSKCNGTDKHHSCDSAAGTAALALYEALEPFIGLHFNKCLYFPADAHRTRVDFNRYPSRDTYFRKQLRKVLNSLGCSRQTFSFECHKDPIIFLDIHSYPNYYLEEAGDINFFKKGEPPPDLVFLEGPLDTFKGQSLSRGMAQSLTKAGFNIKIIRGIVVNDLMNEAEEYRIPAVLIEWNEKFLQDLEMMRLVCRILASYLAILVG